MSVKYKKKSQKKETPLESQEPQPERESNETNTEAQLQDECIPEKETDERAEKECNETHDDSTEHVDNTVEIKETKPLIKKVTRWTANKQARRKEMEEVAKQIILEERAFQKAEKEQRKLEKAKKLEKEQKKTEKIKKKAEIIKEVVKDVIQNSAPPPVPKREPQYYREPIPSIFSYE